METKTFGDKKIIIRSISKKDLKNPKKFQVFINSLIEENAKILMNKKATIKQEIGYIKGVLDGAKNKTSVQIVAECDNKIVGNTDIKLEPYSRNHIGKFGIVIKNGYRGIGLGNYLMSEVIKLAAKGLNPRPKIIQLEAHINNKPAISLYKKMGFKIVAKIPKQLQYNGKLVGEVIMMREL